MYVFAIDECVRHHEETESYRELEAGSTELKVLLFGCYEVVIDYFVFFYVSVAVFKLFVYN